MKVQWFPGHMSKALGQMRENLRIVDFVIELLDARIPISSSNPELSKLIPTHKRIIVLNKDDLAHPRFTFQWLKYFNNKSVPAVAVDSVKGDKIRDLLRFLEDTGKKNDEKWQKKGRRGRPIRIMVAGIPNVGKSSLINRLAKRACAKTGAKPGVTRGKQWIKVTDAVYLLDTPGVLWPKFDKEDIGVNLALTGAIKSEVLNAEGLALRLIEKLTVLWGGYLEKHYGITELAETPHEILMQIGEKRGTVVKGGRIDSVKAAEILLRDFKNGRLGRVSLEYPGSYDTRNKILPTAGKDEHCAGVED